MAFAGSNVYAGRRVIFSLNFINRHNHPTFSKNAYVVINMFVLHHVVMLRQTYLLGIQAIRKVVLDLRQLNVVCTHINRFY